MLTKEEFLQEIDSVKDDYIIEKIKAHNLPVIIFGTAAWARWVSAVLPSFKINISGYAVDEEYYKPDQTYLGLPIYNFAELAKSPEKYVFIRGIGTGADKLGKNRSPFLKDKNIIKYALAMRRHTIDYDFITENSQQFWETYSWLSDKFSKKTFEYYLKAHLTYNADYILPIITPNDYFNELTRDSLIMEGGTFVDCGAYTGDTIEGFIKFSRGYYKKIFAFEPDEKILIQLQEFIKDNEYENIALYNCGLWNKKGILTFKSLGDSTSFVSEDGDIKLPVDTIDNIVGDEPVSFIKMDIEGSELPALQGAVKTLERSRPILAICVYHKKEDLITIPQFIKSVYKNCRFYLRKHCESDVYELVLYVVPE